MGKKIGREYELASTAQLAKAVQAASPLPKVSRRMERDLAARLGQRHRRMAAQLLSATSMHAIAPRQQAEKVTKDQAKRRKPALQVAETPA